MAYRIGTSRPLEEIDRGLQESAARHRFGILAIHDLQETMRKKGVDLAMECRIYEVCNPLRAKKVEGNYTPAAMLPTDMMKAFGKPEIEPVAREVEDVILQMMREAASDGDCVKSLLP
ncbi:MAG: DUF302 domain-containing protein [Bryobacteraceae bacterium]|jgi:hypothetical protein